MEIRKERKRLLDEAAAKERERLNKESEKAEKVEQTKTVITEEDEEVLMKRLTKDKAARRSSGEYKEDHGDKKVIKKSRKNQSNISDMFKTDINSILDGELKSSLEELKSQLEQARLEKEKLLSELNLKNEEITVKNQEIEILRNKKQANDINSSTAIFSAEEKEEYKDQIKKLRQEILDKDSNIDILSLKVDELSKSNKDLVSSNDSLKDQLAKRKAKMESEMTSLYSQIREYEIKKLEYERNKNNDNRLSNYKDTEAIADLKLENKSLTKKVDDIKTKFEKEIMNMKNEIFMKDNRIKDCELAVIKSEKELRDKSESYNTLKNEYEIVKREIDMMKFKVDIVNKNSNECEGELNKMKGEFDNNIKKKDLEIKELKSNLDVNNQLVERGKKMEKALKNELQLKDEELQKRQELISEIRIENDKLVDEIMVLKKETLQLQSKLEALEYDYKNRSVNDSQMKEFKAVKEKERKYEKIINEMKETLVKKQKIIDNKKKMNLLLVELAKIKKGEVQCIETLQITNSSNVRETLNKLKENEKDLLSK